MSNAMVSGIAMVKMEAMVVSLQVGLGTKFDEYYYIFITFVQFSVNSKR